MTAGELADRFDVSKPTMSAHFAVLREADLVDATKKGTTITYRLKLSVLEDALLGFAETFGLEPKPARRRAIPRRVVAKEV
jgi:DNA-binding transcriptional ArsR family regulator